MDRVQNFILNSDSNGSSCSLQCPDVNKVWFNGHKILFAKSNPTFPTRCKLLGQAPADQTSSDTALSPVLGRTQNVALWAWLSHLGLELYSTVCAHEAEFDITSASIKCSNLLDHETQIINWSVLSVTLDSPLGRELCDGFDIRIKFCWVREEVNDNLDSSHWFFLWCKDLGAPDILWFHCSGDWLGVFYS